MGLLGSFLILIFVIILALFLEFFGVLGALGFLAFFGFSSDFWAFWDHSWIFFCLFLGFLWISNEILWISFFLRDFWKFLGILWNCGNFLRLLEFFGFIEISVISQLEHHF